MKYSSKVFLHLNIVLILALLPMTFSDTSFDMISRYIDDQHDPCNSFFDYACGKWSSFHQTEYYSEIVGLLDYSFNNKLLHYLQSYNFGTNPISDLVWTYYRSCRVERKKSIARYLEIFNPSSELNWPLLEQLKEAPHEWAKEKFNWLLTSANLRRYGFNNLIITERVVPSNNNTAESLITLDGPVADKMYLLPNQTVVLVVLTEIGLSLPKAMKLAKKLEKFELELKELFEADLAADYGYIRVSLREVRKYLPNWPWAEYFSVLINQTVSEDFEFQIDASPYFSKLDHLLNRTDPELLCNYIMFHFVYQMVLDGSDSSNKLDCVAELRSKMELAMNFIYAEQFLQNKTAVYEGEVRRLIDIMRNEFRRKVSENRLELTTAEQDFVNQKLDRVDVVMGNLPKNTNQAFVEEYYDGIELQRDNYYNNRRVLLQLMFVKEHEPLSNKKSHSGDYFFIGNKDTASSSAPFYLLRQNVIVVPYGFVQPPFFHTNMSDILKYSSLGFVLAHEMVHGFDGNGFYYDRNGLRQNIGSNILTNRHFSEALRCMSSNENNANINEDVADLVGLRLAYDAYFNDPARNVTLDKKLFFLNFAQFFCGMDNVNFVDHDSDKARLEKVLMSMKVFAETFRCEFKDRMNPAEKCRLW